MTGRRVRALLGVLGLVASASACSSGESAFCKAAKDVLANGPEGAELVVALRAVPTGDLNGEAALEWEAAVDQVDASVEGDNSWDMKPAGEFAIQECPGEVAFRGPAHP